MASFFKKSNKQQEPEEDFALREPEVRITKGMYGRLIYRKVFQMLGLAALALIVLYLCFAATWVRFVPTLSGAGIVPVKNITYDGGILPKGSQVLVDTESAQGDKIQDRLKQAFVPSNASAKVQVIAGPYGEMSWVRPNILTVDGEPIGVPFPGNQDGSSPIDFEDPFLKDQYVAICISGDCTPGEAFIFDRDHVYGSLLSKTDL